THLARLLLAGVGVGGTAGQQHDAGYNGGQSTPVLHRHSLLILVAGKTPHFDGWRRQKLRARVAALVRKYRGCGSFAHAFATGLSRISSPSCVSGPWPVTTTASSSST